MPDFLNSEVFQTAMGAVILLFILVLALKIGPLRFVGEMLAQVAINILFIVIAVGVLFLFAATEIGQSMGGVGTGLIVVLALPFILLIVSLAQSWRKRHSNQDTKATDDDR